MLFGCRVNVTVPADKDIVAIEVKATASDTNAAIDYVWSPYDGADLPTRRAVVPGQQFAITLYNRFANPGYVRVRVVSSSNVGSDWLRLGNASLNCIKAVGDLTFQAKSAVDITGGSIASGNISTTGIKTGGGSSNKVLVRAPYIAGVTLTGGSPSETYNLDISGWGFSSAPDVGLFHATNFSSWEIRYDWDDSTSANAVLRIRDISGANIPAGAFLIFCGELTEYF